MTISHQLKRFVQVAALGVAIMSGTAAQAQFGEAAGIAEAMQQDYLRRDIVLFQQGLNLDDAQRAIIDSLYGDYEQSFNDGMAQMRKRIEDMREQLQSTDVDQVLRIVFKPIEDWSKDKRALGDTFLENVKVVLTPDQQQQWPKFERFLFREKNLSKGTLSGETLNLFNIVRDMKLNEPEMAAVQVVLDQYDVALDEALKNRQRALTSNQSDMLKSFSEQNSAVSLAILQRQIDMAIAVRNVNDRFIEELTKVMPQDRQSEFRQNALERAYPRVYRPTPVQNIFKVAKGLEGLDSLVLQSITEMEAAYLGELNAANTELADATRRWEPAEQRLRAEAFAQRMAGQQPAEIEDQTRDAYLKRDEVAHRYTRQLKAILTDAQFAQLPGGYRWADVPGEVKPVNQAMPDGQGGMAARKGPRGAQGAEPTPPKAEGGGGKGGG